MYVNVDEGRIFLDNDAAGEPLDLVQGESGYIADLTSLPVKLSLIPAFQALDKIPSPSQLDFDNIQISDDAVQAIEPEAEVAVVAVAVIDLRLANVRSFNRASPSSSQDGRRQSARNRCPADCDRLRRAPVN